MKIYVITFDEVCDFSILSHNPKAFAKKEDAKKAFDEIVAESKKYVNVIGWIEEETETSYETYRDGYWPENHYSVYLYELELQ